MDVRSFLVALVLLASTAFSHAQGIPSGAVVTLSQERLYQSSEFGRRVQQELQSRAETLSIENRRIEAELIAEERALTEERPKLDPEEFRRLAEDFDTRVTAIRKAQADKGREIQAFGQSQRDAFFERAIPVLLQLMEDTGAAAILSDTAVILSRNQTDITEVAIARMNAALAGSDMVEPQPSEPAPENPEPSPEAPLLVPQTAD